jgi:hypothetical protein
MARVAAAMSSRQLGHSSACRVASASDPAGARRSTSADTAFSSKQPIALVWICYRQMWGKVA